MSVKNDKYQVWEDDRPQLASIILQGLVFRRSGETTSGLSPWHLYCGAKYKVGTVQVGLELALPRLERDNRPVTHHSGGHTLGRDRAIVHHTPHPVISHPGLGGMRLARLWGWESRVGQFSTPSMWVSHANDATSKPLFSEPLIDAIKQFDKCHKQGTMTNYKKL